MSFYVIEIHFEDYDVIGVTAATEQEAHRKAKMMFEAANRHIIGVTATGINQIDGIELEADDDGEHTVEWR